MCTRQSREGLTHGSFCAALGVTGSLVKAKHACCTERCAVTPVFFVEQS